LIADVENLHFNSSVVNLPEILKVISYLHSAIHPAVPKNTAKDINVQKYAATSISTYVHSHVTRP
jgi:hypothetical protein